MPLNKEIKSNHQTSIRSIDFWQALLHVQVDLELMATEGGVHNSHSSFNGNIYYTISISIFESNFEYLIFR